MGRTKGAKNKEKSVEFHLNALKNLGYPIPEGEASTPSNIANEEVLSTIEQKPTGGKKDLIINVKETDNINPTFTCGNCRHSLPSEVDICPNCGTELMWK